MPVTCSRGTGAGWGGFRNEPNFACSRGLHRSRSAGFALPLRPFHRSALLPREVLVRGGDGSRGLGLKSRLRSVPVVRSYDIGFEFGLTTEVLDSLQFGFCFEHCSLAVAEVAEQQTQTAMAVAAGADEHLGEGGRDALGRVVFGR